MGALDTILKDTVHNPVVKAGAWTVNALNRDVKTIHDIPNDIAGSLHIKKNIAAKIPLSIWDTLAPASLPSAVMLAMTGDTGDVAEAGEEAGAKVIPSLVKGIASKGAVFGTIGSTLSASQDIAERRFKDLPRDVASNFIVGGALGGLTEIIPALYIKVMKKIANKDVIDKITPALFKKAVSKVGELLGHTFNMFGKNDEAYKTIIENENQKYIAHYASAHLAKSIEDNPEVIEKIGGDSNPFNAAPQAFKNGIFTKNMETLAKEYGLSPEDITQLSNIRKARREIAPFLEKTKQAYTEVSNNLRDYSKSTLKLTQKEKKIGIDTSKKLRTLFSHANSMDNISKKGLNVLEKTIDRFNNIKEKIDNPLNKSIDKAKASELINNLLDKIQREADKLGEFTDKKAEISQKGADRFADMAASKQFSIWSKMSKIAKQADDKISAIPERLTVPFDEYYSMADKPLNSIKMRYLEPEDLVKKKVAHFTREDTENHLTNTFSHSNAIMNIKKLDLNLSKRDINPDYWAAKLSKTLDIPMIDLRYMLKGLPQATSSEAQIEDILTRRLSELPNAKNIAHKIVGSIYDDAGMSEGVNEKEMEKLGGSPLFMSDNPMLKYSHDKTMSPVYGHLTGETSQINNWLDKLSVGLKRFRVGLLPTYHMFSETKSGLFAGLPARDIVNTLRLSKPSFRKFIVNTYTEVSQELEDKGVPFMTYFGRPVTFSKEEGGRISKIILGNKYMKASENLLWGRMYPTYKLLSAKRIAKDLTNNVIDAKTAEYRLNMVNAFFGGLPELALRLPNDTKTTIRNLIFSPDWGLSLLKQMGYALHGQDEHAVRYYTNMLAYNIFIRQAFQLFTGQPNSLTQLKNEHSVNSLYSTTGNLGNNPVLFNVLGYEKEYPDLIFEPLKTLFEAGLDAGAHKFMYRAGSKLGVLPHIAYSMGEWNKGKKGILNLLTPVMPFAVSTIMENPSWNSVLPSILSSGLGVTATPMLFLLKQQMK
mgnify:CR=1 FL=1